MSSGIFPRVITSLVAAVALGASVSGCNICEEGAQCGGDNEGGKAGTSKSQADQCLAYCDRLNICGASQASDLDACVKACEARFQRLPEQTAALCACIPDSRCEDAVEGRCSDQSSAAGTGGASSTGGASGTGGTHATGGSSATGGTHATGGSNATGGSSHGGASASGGTSASSGGSSGGAAGSAGASCGGTAGDASGGSSAGADIGAAGGGDQPTACTCDCQCAAPELCVDGYCSTSG